MTARGLFFKGLVQGIANSLQRWSGLLTSTTIFSVQLIFLSSVEASHLPPIESPSDGEPYNVLVVHSYHPEHPWTHQEKLGIDAGFEDSDHDIAVYHEFLDSKRYPKLQHQKVFLDHLLTKYEDTSFDVLIVTDDPSLDFILETREAHFPRLPVVFMGVNESRKDLVIPPWITGVYETHDMTETLLEAKRQTGSDSLIILSDSSSTGQAKLKQFQQIKSLEGLPKDIIIIEDLLTTNIVSKLDAYPDDWPIYPLGYLRVNSVDGPLLTSRETAELLHEKLPNPIYTTVINIGSGVVGGKVLDGRHHAKQAVNLVEKILEGTPVGELAPVTEAHTQWFFDEQALKKANLSLDGLPPDSILINSQTSFYQQYRNLVWTVTLTFGLGVSIIAVLMHAIRRQKKAEQQLIENQKYLEQRVAERTAELAKAKAVADNASQAKSEFLANMSHELRTPLNGILGYTQILKQANLLSTEERKGVSIIHRCGSHLLTLINDVLDFSKIEARRLELTPTETDFLVLLQGVFEMFELRAKEKKLEFLYQPDHQLPKKIEVDEKRLRQVLFNLLSNAIKFTHYGQVILKVDVLHLNDTQATLHFRVIDTGIGIAEVEQLKLFQSFQQVGDRQQQSEGTGLGLVISQRIINLMGGHIQVKSQLASGSEFFFTLELPVILEKTYDQTFLSQLLDQDKRRIIGYKGERKTVLIVDDHWANRSVLNSFLTPLGFQIIEAKNGQEALKKLQLTPPGLVITDLIMPVMDGFEFIREVRKLKAFQALKILVSSASVSQQEQHQALAIGGNDYLKKPVELKVLRQLLEEHLNLEWCYEEGHEASNVPADVQSSEMVLPSPEILGDLWELTQQANLPLFKSRIEQLAKTHSAYDAFVQKVMQLYGQQDIDALGAFLKERFIASMGDYTLT